MITVPEGTKKIVERSRYLSEAISKGLINYSALARYIKPELEAMLVKKISQASIIMALKRLESEFKPRFQPQKAFKKTPVMNIRSGLNLFSIENKEVPGIALLLDRTSDPKSFYLKTQGIDEVSIVVSGDLFEKYNSTIIGKSSYIHKFEVSALTIYFPDQALDNSGIYYFFLKSLAWEGVNILEIFSTLHELTLILDEKDVETAFSVTKTLFKPHDRIK